MIALASDHTGAALKKEIIGYLEKRGLDYNDLGAYNDISVDYPDYARLAADAVLSGGCARGVIICGTGIGISISANRIPGIRAALCHDVYSARCSRAHNDANLLALGSRVVGVGLALEIVGAYLDTEFSGEERHKRRIEKIENITRSPDA